MSYFWFLIVCILLVLIWKNYEKSKQDKDIIIDQQKKLDEQRQQLDLTNKKLNRIGEFEEVIKNLKIEIEDTRTQYLIKKNYLDEVESRLRLYSNDLDLIDQGVYEPIFSFELSNEYKEALMCAELAGDFHLGDSRQLTDKSLLPFDLVS
ncbi:hypothetical protein [Acinetobacter nosocomialis]|uniref:hypothetical protein n=1 Tax=Acinetobacter nosocomialis TaxID=106654 RepID=UPI002455E956|nr:hypothetical protein [Acinetobacter nosocomialis]